jgi:hypothetical protein
MRWAGTGRGDVRDELLAKLRLAGVPDGHLEEAEIRSRYDTVAALAVGGLRRKKVETILRQLRLDAAWMVHDGVPELITLDAAVPKDEVDRLAVAGGDVLTALLKKKRSVTEGESPLSSWTAADRRGWVSGGPLGGACDTCTVDLEWYDWQHEQAPSMTNSWYAFCPAHGAVFKGDRRRLVPLIHARRQLDSALRAGSTAGVRSCYVFEIKGLDPDTFYVGQTTKTPTQRRREHREGIRTARVLRKPGVSVGPLRQNLLPTLPELHGEGAALAAEQWVATVLRHQGKVIHGGH